MAAKHPSSGSSSSPAARAAIEAELTVLADSVEGYRERVAGIAGSAAAASRSGSATDSGPGSEDLVAAMHEAERALRSASRHLQRAVKLSR